MKDLPYYTITSFLFTVGDDDADSVDIALDFSELTFKREAYPKCKEKGLAAIPKVELTFPIEEAIKLRDFLNFALPAEK